MTEKKSSDTSDYDVDFENEEFDKIYNSLGKKDRKDLFENKPDGTFKAKYSTERTKEILRDLNSPEITDLYKNYLTIKEREFVDTVKLPERIEKIRGLGGQNKWKVDNGIIKKGDDGVLKPKEINIIKPSNSKTPSSSSNYISSSSSTEEEEKEKKYEIEDEVEVYNPDERTRLHAIIIKVNTDNTYDVMYDDDSEESDILAKYISYPEKYMKKKDVLKSKYLEGRVHTPEVKPHSPEFEPHSPEFEPQSPDMPPPSEVLEKDIDMEEEEEEKTKTSSQILFSNIVDTYYKSRPYDYEAGKMTELEVRFGTRGIRKLTKNDYDSVIKTLRSFGFITNNPNGEYSLRIQNEFLNNMSGKFELSNIRTEINGIEQIKIFCKSNNIKELIKSHGNSVKFTKKSAFINDKKEKVRPVNFDDFNFRVSLQKEEQLSGIKGTGAYIVNTWRNNKKTFRFLNRVTFTHEEYPINVDISIVKSTDFKGNRPATYYTTDEADVFNKLESYEIELEVNNKMVGPGSEFKNYNIILESLRKVIKFVLSGLQRTNFPISYPEQKMVIGEYMKLLFKDAHEPGKNVYPSNFIGPSSYTLQRINITPINDNLNVPNIRKNYTVTDKADGERNLMYISIDGKIYLINTSMSVIFTGAKTEKKELFNSLLDGELILHDKFGRFINLFAAFDIYYFGGVDVRSYTFMISSEEPNMEKSRYALLNRLIQNLEITSILGSKDKRVGKEEQKSSFKSLSQKLQTSFNNSPIRVTCKRFYPENPETGNIFSACNQILTKQKNGLFEYEMDGLIFTPAFMGVGSDKVGVAGPLSKITWDYSFKWKPPQFNTIDFLVTTVKSSTGDDVIKNIFEEGTSANSAVQLSQYKPIELRCTFVEKKHGFINPCQDIIDDKLPEYNNNQDEKVSNEAKPMIFYPTSPYDPDAGFCNIMLKKDGNNSLQMFTQEDEVFGDNTIVEFSYSFDNKKGWNWIPLRVRYDKTTEMLQGIKNFGNAYHVANSNWQSIHNPITEDMISTGLNIPETGVDDDVYYNKPSGIMKTEGLKNFHNLYVKKLLIKSVSKRDDTLIDYACGKAGDLSKWIAAKLSFVYGIDISKDNLENRIDGACARYLKARKQNKHMPYALFVNGNSALNIKNGTAMKNDKAIQITKAIFGIGTEKSELIGKGVARQYGVGAEGFNVSSCQFAIHYFFKDPETLQGFLKNIAECTKLNGYFIGTAYDGKLIYKLLAKKARGESTQIYEDDKKIWEIVKEYDFDKFEDNSSSLGYRIDVYQESINQLLTEYLVNFDYFNRVMENYGFKIVEREEEAQSMGLPEGTGLFSELYMNMMEEIKANKFKANDYGNAQNMSVYEQKISFLNRYFVYKKFRTVNADKVELDLADYDEDERSAVEMTEKYDEGKEETISKPKIKKLNKKILLVPATEAIEEQAVFKLTEKVKKQTKKSATETKPKKKLIIEDEE